MSFKTYVDYNSDNIVKAIENVRDLKDTSKEDNGMINKIVKNAALIYTFENGVRTTWEKTLRKVWFNWATYETVDDDRMSDILENLSGDAYDYLEV